MAFPDRYERVMVSVRGFLLFYYGQNQPMCATSYSVNLVCIVGIDYTMPICGVIRNTQGNIQINPRVKRHGTADLLFNGRVFEKCRSVVLLLTETAVIYTQHGLNELFDMFFFWTGE